MIVDLKRHEPDASISEIRIVARRSPQAPGSNSCCRDNDRLSPPTFGITMSVHNFWFPMGPRSKPAGEKRLRHNSDAPKWQPPDIGGDLLLIRSHPMSKNSTDARNCGFRDCGASHPPPVRAGRL
jgi:hypothetical protein